MMLLGQQQHVQTPTTNRAVVKKQHASLFAECVDVHGLRVDGDTGQLCAQRGPGPAHVGVWLPVPEGRQRLATIIANRARAGHAPTQPVEELVAWLLRALPRTPRRELTTFAWSNGIFYAHLRYFAPREELELELSQKQSARHLVRQLLTSEWQIFPSPLSALVASYLFCTRRNKGPQQFIADEPFNASWYYETFGLFPWSKTRQQPERPWQTLFDPLCDQINLLRFWRDRQKLVDEELWFVLGMIGRFLFTLQLRDKWRLACVFSGSEGPTVLRALSRLFGRGILTSLEESEEWRNETDRKEGAGGGSAPWVTLVGTVARIQQDDDKEGWIAKCAQRGAELVVIPCNVDDGSVAPCFWMCQARFVAPCTEAYLWWSERFGRAEGFDWVPSKFRRR